MRAGQRNPDSFKRVEGDKMPALRVAKAFEEIVSIRLIERDSNGRAELHRKAEFVWDVRNGATAFALS